MNNLFTKQLIEDQDYTVVKLKGKVPMYLGQKEEASYNYSEPYNSKISYGLKLDNTPYVVLDFDIYTDNLKSSFKRFPKEFQDEMKSTLITSSPSGGKHVYFELSKTQKCSMFTRKAIKDYGLDVLAKGNIVLPGSIYSPNYKITDKLTPLRRKILEHKMSKKGVRYKQDNNNSIMKISDSLYSRLIVMMNMNGKKPTTINLPTNSNAGKFKYFLPDYVIDEFIKCVKIHHEKYFAGDFIDWLIITSAFKTINHKETWDLLCKEYGGDQYDKENNRKYWDYASTNYFSLECVNKTLRFCRSVGVYKMKTENFNSIKPDVIINNRYLSDGIKLTPSKNYIIKSDCKSGKSYLLANYLSKHKLKFISITNRVKLSEEQHKVFKKKNKLVEHYKNSKFNNPKCSYTIQLDSIMKMKHCFLYNDIKLDEYVLILDELPSLIRHFRSSTLDNNKRKIVFECFWELLTSCKQVIGCSANIDDNCIELFKEAGINDLEYIYNEYRTYKDVVCQEISSFTQMIDEIEKCYKEENIIPLIMSDQRLTDGVHDVKKQLEKRGINIVGIDSCTDKKVLKNLDLDSGEIYMFSPTIQEGLNCIKKRKVFCFWNGNTICPNSMFQMMCRSRNPDKIYFRFNKPKFIRPEYDTKQSIDEEVKDIIKYGLRKNTKLIISPLEKTFNIFIKNDMYMNDTITTNCRLWFKKILVEAGFKVIDCHIITNRTNRKVESKEMMNGLIEDFSVDNSVVKSINLVLKLSDEDILKHKQLFIEPRKLQEHRNRCELFISKKNISPIGTNDYLLTDIKTIKSKMQLLRYWEKKLNIDINSEITCDNTHVELFTKEYKKHVKRARFTNTPTCKELFTKLLRIIIGRSAVKRKRIRSGIDKGKYNYIVDKKILEVDREIYSNRDTYILSE